MCTWSGNVGNVGNDKIDIANLDGDVIAKELLRIAGANESYDIYFALTGKLNIAIFNPNPEYPLLHPTVSYKGESLQNGSVFIRSSDSIVFTVPLPPSPRNDVEHIWTDNLTGSSVNTGTTNTHSVPANGNIDISVLIRIGLQRIPVSIRSTGCTVSSSQLAGDSAGGYFYLESNRSSLEFTATPTVSGAAYYRYKWRINNTEYVTAENTLFRPDPSLGEVNFVACTVTPIIRVNYSGHPLVQLNYSEQKFDRDRRRFVDENNIGKNDYIVSGGTLNISDTTTSIETYLYKWFYSGEIVETSLSGGSRSFPNYAGNTVRLDRLGPYYTVSYPNAVTFTDATPNLNDLGNYISGDNRLQGGVRNFKFTSLEEIIDGKLITEYYWTYTDAAGEHTDTTSDNTLSLINYNFNSSLDVRVVGYGSTYTLNIVKSGFAADSVQVRTYIRKNGADSLVNNMDTLLPGGQVVIKCAGGQLRKYVISVNNTAITINSDTEIEYLVGNFNRHINVVVNTQLSPRTDVAGYRYETTAGVFDVTGDTIAVPNNVYAIKLYPVASPENPFVLFDTVNASLRGGVNTVRLTVTAPDGTTQRDTAFTVFRQPSTELSIAGFVVRAVDPVLRDTIAFNNPADTIRFPYQYTVLHFQVIPTNDNPYVTADNAPYAVTQGTGSHNFTIYAEDVTVTNSYTITYTRLPPSSDTSIEGVLINNRLFTGEDVIEYTVPYETVRITVAGKKKADNQYVTFSGIGGLNLNRGMNEFNFRVTAQDGETERIIRLKIFRELVFLNNTAVENILLDMIAFPDGNVNYETPYEHDTVTIAVRKLIDNLVTVTGEGRYPLKPGDNAFKLVITAQGGAKREISVNIHRKPTSDISTEIESITVAGNDTVFVFNSFPVLLSAPYHLSTVRINAKLSDAGKGASVSGEGTYRLAAGRNEFKIKVTSADGTREQEYDIFISRFSGLYEVKRISYTPNIYGYSELDLSQLYHEITMPYTVAQINFLVEKDPSNENVTVTGDG
ncbi:MAG: hypothetical protein LBF08_02000, partial [Dysgonamonadaceae bacterium]|nr:hypothetical protein [Dysgonamonadaceae bacterium]